jgi:hypothetical protein
MRKFADFIQPKTILKVEHTGPEGFGSEVAEQQRQAEEQFPQLVHELGLANFRLWQPGDRIPQEGRHTMVGVAPWSWEDMRLLDELARVLAAPGAQEGVVYVFDFFSVCQSQEKLEQFAPGMDLRTIFATPVVAIWNQGTLEATASGAQGKSLLMQIYGLTF